jgi:hypothetical protein
LEREFAGSEKIGYKVNVAGCQWLMPVILATQGAEIRRIAGQSQHREIVPQAPILKKSLSQKGLVDGFKV